MKKTLITLIAVFGFYNLSLAQTKGNIEFGVQAGFTNSSVQVNANNSSYNFFGGFNTGLTGDYYFSDRWSFKAALNYDQKGWGNGFIITPNGVETDHVSYRLNYLTVPLMANWHFGHTRNWYLNFGPYVGFLLSASNSAYNTDIKSSFNSVDGGLAFGIGIKIPVSPKTKIFFEYGGQSGVSNIFSNTTDGSRVQNVMESINVGFNF